MRIKKITLGIRPSQKMFRVSSLHGTLVDSVLSLRGTKPIDDEYYKEITRSVEQGIIQLRNEDQGNTLRVDLENVVFIKDFYASEKQINVDDVLKEFRAIWKQINEVLRVRDIRRIGLVAEHRTAIEKDNPSAVLLKKLTSISAGAHPAKFILRFEDRRLTTKGGIPDFKKDDFTNVICDYYDSEVDAEHPKQDHFNANLDVQRYYSPLFNGNVFDEVVAIRQQFSKEQDRVKSDLKQRGLL